MNILRICGALTCLSMSMPYLGALATPCICFCSLRERGVLFFLDYCDVCISTGPEVFHSVVMFFREMQFEVLHPLVIVLGNIRDFVKQKTICVYFYV